MGPDSGRRRPRALARRRPRRACHWSRHPDYPEVVTNLGSLAPSPKSLRAGRDSFSRDEIEGSIRPKLPSFKPRIAYELEPIPTTAIRAAHVFSDSLSLLFSLRYVRQLQAAE